MGLFSRNRSNTALSREEFDQQLKEEREKQQFYLFTILVLFQYIQKFSFDLDEINAETFKERITRLSQQFETEEETKRIKRQFEGNKGEIASFIDRERDYFFNKDREFKEIIQVLTSGIASMNQENQHFNSRIHEESLKIETITQLNDIRKMKAALAENVGRLKQFIEKKQAHDTKRIDALANEVETLREELEKTKNISMTDGLTGVFNRLAFDSHITKLIERNKTSRTPFSLMMIDIDNFKLINDSYGHLVGDRVIVALVQKCRQFIREDDFLSRYGGEEFVAILLDTSLRQTMKRARNLCEAVSDALYAVDDSDESEPLSFTVSIGVSTYRRGDAADSVVERADKALYTAKDSGKNQAVSEKEIE